MSAEALHPALEKVNPRRVAEHFDAIRQIPRASGNEAGVREYAISIARARGLTHRVDEVGNLAIDIPASPGSEEKPRVMLQGHMDMVCVKTDDSSHDFSRDPIELEATGDWVHAKGYKTTLGADDGLGGIAMTLAIAEETDLPHPPITILLTVDEEVGLKGAQELGDNLVPRDVRGVINLDAEEGPNEICNGCASGHHLHAKWESPSRQEVPSGYQGFEIKLEGLRGGHSGTDIHRGRGNAITLLNHFLVELRERIPDLMLESFNGGQKFNAIAAFSSCIVHVPQDKVGILEALLSAREAELKRQYENAEAKNQVSLSKKPVEEPAKRALVRATRDQLLNTLRDLPDGVIEKDASGFVTVSDNVGVVKTGDDIEVATFARGALHKASEAGEVVEQIRRILQDNGARIIDEGYHDGWQEPPDSRLVRLAEEVVREAGGEPHVFAYHAGLESKVIKDRLTALGYDTATMSSVAIGPHLMDAHSTKERIVASSVEPTYQLLKRMLEKLAA